MPLVTAAVDDLAGRLGIEPPTVTVVDARAVTWGDSSLGCPEPGMMYLQVSSTGRSSSSRRAAAATSTTAATRSFLCENPKAPSGGG